MLLKKLTDACGLPGQEAEVRDIIKEELEGCVDSIKTDRMGNLIVVKNAAATGKHIALSAHMDEVGLVVKHIDSAGYIKFATYGIDPRILVAKAVKIGKNKISGVIGSKPIHLQKPDERTNSLELRQLYIDIGANTKEEAEKLVSKGDYIAFDSDYVEFGESKVKAKALDDRVGCALIIELLKSDFPYKLTGVFCVEEEVGLRGSAIAANQVTADLVINIEGTICADTGDIPEHRQVTTQGKGPAISLIDRTSVYLKEYISDITETADKYQIPWQYRRTGMGGTDAANYHIAHGGTPAIGISVPCRYIHSPISVMDKRDYDNAYLLLSKYITRYMEI